MNDDGRHKSSVRILEPIERISEVLFGLIMVLTFTGSLSAAESGQAEVRTMLVGALGCNLAWGLIDAIMYLMATLSERATDRRTVLEIQRASSPDHGKSIIRRALPPVVAAAMTPAELQRIYDELIRMQVHSERPRLGSRDWLGAVAVFLLVFASTIPVVLPFIFLQDAMVALRVSNVIAIAMMFATGYLFGRLAGYSPLVTGGSMVLLGTLLVVMTIALGG